MVYYPCAAELKSGEVLDRVYVVSRSQFTSWWGPNAESDPGKGFVDESKVARLWSSPHRLPARFANELYRSGESGMGYVIFTVRLKDGSQKNVLTGNAVDFVEYPKGLGPEDVLSVSPLPRPFENFEQAPKYSWCVVNDEELAA